MALFKDAKGIEKASAALEQPRRPLIAQMSAIVHLGDSAECRCLHLPPLASVAEMIDCMAKVCTHARARTSLFIYSCLCPVRSKIIGLGKINVMVNRD